ncbi:uncharacterized protein LOC105661755 isoform X2 [Megachile rotundata]|uniref:uncharacterized protein LOC105661755 isoform X2 n=2 Tax=Megachile rotundata TaxID=143995 RepID=UPI003FD630F0
MDSNVRIFINSSKILSSLVGIRKMKMLLAYIMVFFQLQLGESIVRQRWQDWFEDAVRQAEEVRWLYYRTRIKQEKELLLLLDQPTLEQHRWIDIKHESSPADVRRVQTRSFCSCESQYEVRDLGDDHYPRYLTVSYCKPKTCQNKFHPCKILYYMVHILRPRETNVPSKWFSGDDEIPETPLPEFLKRKWQLKPVSVPVACVPA